MDSRAKAVRECCARLKEAGTAEDFFKLKKSVGEKYRLKDMIKNSEVFEALVRSGRFRKETAASREAFRSLLKTRRVRSLSGVSVVAVMTRPYPCPGECVYCPPAGLGPKSYTGFEPAALRARQNDFDAFRQVRARIGQLEALGHEPDKCELIVMGGTFNALPLAYRRRFIKRCFDGFNGSASETLAEAVRKNESTRHRVVGLTLETRPDYCSEVDIGLMLSFGCTRVELGVQSLYDDVLEKVKRGHSVQETVEATRRCKDAFLKVGWHVMPGLFADKRKDAAMFKAMFYDQRFRPDMLKVYPCLVLEGTPLFDLWKKKKFKPYSTEDAVETISECKRFVPEYCRVMRVDRDIPTNLIVDGVKNSNLRELVKKRMNEKGWKCSCIRCREAGLARKEVDWDAVELRRFDYRASGGREMFLSFADSTNDLLLGFLRLREPFKPFRPEIVEGAFGVRELHVYGEQVPIGSFKEGAFQHRHLGRELLAEAEKIAFEEFDAPKLLVLSGVGVKKYYKKFGYGCDGAYVSKKRKNQLLRRG